MSFFHLGLLFLSLFGQPLFVSILCVTFFDFVSFSILVFNWSCRVEKINFKFQFDFLGFTLSVCLETSSSPFQFHSSFHFWELCFVQTEKTLFIMDKEVLLQGVELIY